MRLYLLLLFFVVGGCSSKVPFKSYGSDISPTVKCILSSSKYSDERISLAEHHHLAVTERIEECQISLGRRYENGIGVEADYELARFYYSLSPSGFRYLASMAENGIGQTVDYLEAERLYRESVSAGVPCSPVNLAMFLEEGNLLMFPKFPRSIWMLCTVVGVHGQLSGGYTKAGFHYPRCKSFGIRVFG